MTKPSPEAGDIVNVAQMVAWLRERSINSDCRCPNYAAQTMITTLAAENATLRASEAAALERVKTITDMATDYLRIATEIGSCGDGGCVVLQQKGQHTNGGCHCLDCLDRSELRRLNGLLGIAQAMAKALTPTADKEPK